MIKEDQFCVIGVDGGASKTRGVLFTEAGDTLASAIYQRSSNLSINPETSSVCIINIIQELCAQASISVEHIDAVGLGIAGSSNQEGRDMVFGRLDHLQLSQRTLIINDAEAAYELSCPGDFGILVTVGTGVICLSRRNGKIIREAGKGHDKGDIGSGYWIGRQAILNLTLNETSVIGDPDLESIMAIFMTYVDGQEFQSCLEKLYQRDDAVTIIAGLAQHIISLAEKGNKIAVAIVQEATHAIADYILTIIDALGYNNNNLILAGNGSVIRNDFFRSSLNDELRFHFPELKWIFSALSPAYGAAILAARIYDIEVNISEILKGDFFVPA